MKVVVLGHGFLGEAFNRGLFEVWGKDKFLITRNRADGDYSPECRKLQDVDVIINCIEESDKKWCDENFIDAMFRNASIPGILSKYCEVMSKKLVHVSTGCLYDRNDKLMKEDDSMAAHCSHTVTKWAGEECLHQRDLIIRPRLLFGDFQNHGNLLTKILRFKNLPCELNTLTSVHTVVEATRALISADAEGVFNVGCDGNETISNLARMIGVDVPVISAMDSNDMEDVDFVNCTMDINKLKEYYRPPQIEDEWLRCWKCLT